MDGSRGVAPVSAILLAAGTSTRFGAQKLLATVAGLPLVCWAARHVRAADVAELVVVLGRDAAAVRAALEGQSAEMGAGAEQEEARATGERAPPPLRFALNRRYAAGMSGSIRVGVRALAADAGAVLVVLGDQPGVAPAVMNRLIACWRGGGGPAVAPAYRGFRGNPVLFDRSLFPELLRLRGDEGARRILHPARVALVPFDLPPPSDVDTPEDRARLAQLDRPEAPRPGG